MEMKLAECAGFCFGVKRAVDTVYEQIETGKTIYTYGPIVHNEEVVKELAEKEKVTEELKANDQILWVQKMNNIRNRVTEIVNAEIIYTV